MKTLITNLLWQSIVVNVPGDVTGLTPINIPGGAIITLVNINVTKALTSPTGIGSTNIFIQDSAGNNAFGFSFTNSVGQPVEVVEGFIAGGIQTPWPADGKVFIDLGTPQINAGSFTMYIGYVIAQ